MPNAAPGKTPPPHSPTAIALLAALLEAGILPPSHRQLDIAADALADHLAAVGLAVVPTPPDTAHRGEHARSVDSPVDDLEHPDDDDPTPTLRWPPVPPVVGSPFVRSEVTS